MSNEAKFTKGPWKYHINTANSVEVVIGDGDYPGWRGDEYLCAIIGEVGRMNNEYNGYLMAAAPEMYELLDKLSPMLTEINAHELSNEIDTLLAKARGEHDIN